MAKKIVTRVLMVTYEEDDVANSVKMFEAHIKKEGGNG